MTAYLIRRLLLLVPTTVLVTIIVFLSVRFVPGDIVDLMSAQIDNSAAGSKESRAILEKALGLDVPIHIQYTRWLGIAPQEDGQLHGLLQGDFGKSLWRSEPVTKLVLQRLPVSLELGLISLLTAVFTALPIGIYSAIRQDTSGDYAGRSLSILFISIPGFWIGTIVMVYPALWWGWSPPLELIPIAKNLPGNLMQFLLPGFIMGMVMGGGLMRLTRTMMLEVMRQDYIRTAWSKGLRENTVIMRHALRNAMLPIITVIGFMVPGVIGGTVVTEQIFALPGVGLLTFEALTMRDYPMISGINLLLAITIMVVNLVVDLAYAWLDPRVQYR